MVVLAVTGFISVIFSYLASINKVKNGLLLAFIFLGFIYVIRDDYGNDFWNYYYHFQEISNFTNFSDCLKERETGWVILNWFFKDFGYHFFLGVIGLFINYVVYRFIKINIPRRLWPLSVLIYVFNPNLYALSFSMIRQFLAMVIFLYCWDYIKQKKIIPLILLLLIATSIHTTAIILLPFVFIGYTEKVSGKIWAILLVSLLLVVSYISQSMESILVLMADNEQLAHYVADHGKLEGSSSFGTGFLILSIPTLLTMFMLFSGIFSKTGNDVVRSMVIIGAFPTFFSLLGQINMLLIRLSLYFTIYTIGSAPVVFSLIKTNLIKRLMILMYCVGLLYSYFVFFAPDSVYAPMYREFHTFLF